MTGPCLYCKSERPKAARMRDAAERIYADDDVDIRKDAKVSWSESGAWVEAWVYVSDETLEEVR